MSETPALARHERESLRIASPRASLARFFCGRLTYASKVSIVTCVAAVLLWWILARVEVVPAMFLPSPLAVASKFFSVWADGFQDATLAQHFLASVGRVSAALVGAMVFGVILGFAMHLSDTGRGVIEPLLEFTGRSLRWPICHSSSSGSASANRKDPRYLPRHSALDHDRDQRRPQVRTTRHGQRRALPRRHAKAGRSARASAARLPEHPDRHPHRSWHGLGDARRRGARRRQPGLGFMIKGAAEFLVTDIVILGVFVIAARRSLSRSRSVSSSALGPWQGNQ